MSYQDEKASVIDGFLNRRNVQIGVVCTDHDERLRRDRSGESDDQADNRNTSKS